MIKINSYNNSQSLPDFLAMQKISFCWFIAYGLSQELNLVSTIHDLGKETDYVLYAGEFKLIKPEYTLLEYRTNMSNMEVEIIIPTQIRCKKSNVIKHDGKYPLFTIPLMTAAGTFIYNGCERVIVSQIARSPGIYFEKPKHKRLPKILKNFKSFKRGNFFNLNDFLGYRNPRKPSIEVFFPEPYREFREFQIRKYLDPRTSEIRMINLCKWEIVPLYKFYYQNVRKKSVKDYYYFLQIFKLYQFIREDSNRTQKIYLIFWFIKWIKSNSSYTFKNNESIYELKYLINYYNMLLKLIFIYKNTFSIAETDLKPFNTVFRKPFKQKFTKAQSTIRKQINSKIITTRNNLMSTVFKYRGKNISKKTEQINKTLSIIKKNIKNIKYNLKLSFKVKNKRLTKIQLRNFSVKEKYKKLLKNQKTLTKTYFKDKVAKNFFFTTKKALIELKEKINIRNHEYEKIYEEKQECKAVIIPEMGSWIRFNFQKSKKVDCKFPLKINEENINIQIDRIKSMPVLDFFKQIGFSDLEIYSNLYHSDFFYHTKPFLIDSIDTRQPIARFRFNVKETVHKISDFLVIFNPKYYRIGKTGRFRINNRLNINLSQKLQVLTYEDLFGIIDELINLSLSPINEDDIDHLKNRRVRSVGELLLILVRVSFQKIIQKASKKFSSENKKEIALFSRFNIIQSTFREFYGSSQLSQYLDETNPLSSLTHRRRISAFGPGGLDRDHVSFSVREIHPSHYGRICPIETPEGKNVGLVLSLTTCGRVNKLGFLETPFWRVLNGKVLKIGRPVYLTADIEDHYKIAPADVPINNKNYLLKRSIPVRYNQDFITVQPSEVDFISITTVQVVSIGTALIPFFEHDDANRALMGSNMQRQSLPLLFPQKPIVGTGFEYQIAVNSQQAKISKNKGVICKATAYNIKVRERSNITYYNLQKYVRSNQETCINQRPIVREGQKIKINQLISDGPSINSNELALGQNLLVAYVPWQGYNFEDAVLISERLIYDNIFTSLYLDRYEITVKSEKDIYEKVTKEIPKIKKEKIKNLSEEGIVKVGTYLNPGDILVGKITNYIRPKDRAPESQLLKAVFGGSRNKKIRDKSYKMPINEHGKVIETVVFNRSTPLGYECEKIHVIVAKYRKIKVGDKISGRHGNKGIVSRILPRQDMPFLPDGTPVDVILNPLGVPSRMNVGQLYECLLGLAGDRLDRRFKILPFDEMYGSEISRILINKKLRQASLTKNEAWLFNPYAPGKIVLVDGRTGKLFDNPITVGNAYILKLIHLVEDKMHARSTGPYSMVTQQPLGGKARQGGQRFGEMEVWALEGFGAAYNLKEILTIKSDDMEGRNEVVMSMIKQYPIRISGVPESFKVLLYELRSLGLSIRLYRIDRFLNTNKVPDNETLMVSEEYDPLIKTFSSNPNY